MADSLVEFCGELRRDTEKALLIFDGQFETWIPKSIIRDRKRIKKRDWIFYIPEWVAKLKGII